MRHLLRTCAIAGVLASGLAACDGGGSGGGDIVVVPPPAPPPAARLEDQFGANFGTSFRTAANSDPRDPQAGDINGVSFTTDPIPVP